MRIAIVHSYYSSRQPSGENIAVDAQVAALRSAGHEVRLMARRTDDIEPRPFHAARSGLHVATGLGASPLREIGSFRPDVVHVHNVFPNWGTHWLKQLAVPLVITLHNYRSVCAAGTLFRAGVTCESCPAKGRLAAIRHGCYRGSRVATLPVALSTRRDASRYPLIARADRVVVLSQRSAAMLGRFGLPTTSVNVVPNFVARASDRGGHRPLNERWIFVGRLTSEKGILELLDNWPVNTPLDIVGDGPLAAQVTAATNGEVRFLGPMTHDAVRLMLPDYMGLVFPSRCAEAAPLVPLEALASGLPVVCAPGNSAADVVTDTGAGLVVESDRSWAAAIAEVSTQPHFREAALAAFERHFSEDAWLRSMEHIYRNAADRGAP